MGYRLKPRAAEDLDEILDSVEVSDIGTIGGGRRKPSGRIDVALVQSLLRKGEVSDLIGGYGHLIVDECHHISAATFERVMRRSKARYVLGLSATVTRKDGHHPIIFMQCGPVRHRVDPPELQATRASMPAIFAALARDERRNTLIVDDVLASLEAGTDADTYAGKYSKRGTGRISKRYE